MCQNVNVPVHLYGSSTSIKVIYKEDTNAVAVVREFFELQFTVYFFKKVSGETRIKHNKL